MQSYEQILSRFSANEWELVAKYIEEHPENSDEYQVVYGITSLLMNYLLTDKVCPHCGKRLFVSDLPKYKYVCTDCDENFFDCEL